LREIDLAMNAAESEVAVHIDEVIKRAKAVDGWDIIDVVSNVDVGVSEILDEHGIGGAMKEQAMDHLENKLFKVLEEISEEKELNVIENEELIEEKLEEEMKGVEAVDRDMSAAESEIATVIEEVLEQLKIGSESFSVQDEVSKVVIVATKILEVHGIEGVEQEEAIDHLNKKLVRVLKEILAEKKVDKLGSEVDYEKDLEEVMYAEAMNAAESDIAAHMDAVIERAKATEGWDIIDVVRKVGVGVNEILDEHGIEGVKKEQAMDHLDNKLSKMLEEIYEEKELNVIRNEEQIEEELEEEIEAEYNVKVMKGVEAVDTDMSAAESEVATVIDKTLKQVKNGSESFSVLDEVSKVDMVATKILEVHGIEGVEQEEVIDHLNKKLVKVLEETVAEKKVEINF